ncbi:hypothetical protein VNI00_013006 [Paramarasmius palmivorus]|uniref:Uncharacterized protein n=1 Tax=Paramarasmius palmivorus TaxID=297713 RepID=A0AAW0BZR6_9AGAR
MAELTRALARLTVADQPSLEAITISPQFMNETEVEFLNSLSVDTAPPLNSARSLSQLVEISFEMYPQLQLDPELVPITHKAFSSFSLDDIRAAYILKVATLALSRRGKNFQDAIAHIRRNGVIRELLRPAEYWSTDQIFVMRMSMTGAVFCDIAIDYLADHYNYGKDYGIVYPTVKFEDWDGVCSVRLSNNDQ